MNSFNKKPQVFITDGNFPQIALDLLKTNCDVEITTHDVSPRHELLNRARIKNALIVVPPNKIDKELLDFAGKQLKCISTYSVGFDHLDVKECRERGITTCHTPNVLTNTVAELGIALMLSGARRVVEASNAITNGEWVKSYTSNWMFGTDIVNSVIGIFGFGRIGQALAKRLQPFEPKKIIYCDAFDVIVDSSLKVEKVNFTQLLEQSDFLIVSSTLTAETYHIFNEDAFLKMKSNALFVNISRGKLVDQTALVSALKNNIIQAAALDVMEEEPIKADDPLLTLPNCTLTPHVGTATFTCRAKMAISAVENVLNFFSNQPIEGEIKI
uniref:Glyoxylate reductase/hydroxypyruvate reductase n=1 Tax=Strigamia maritima TaxID=126957 RepID=T1IRP0_STRMM